MVVEINRWPEHRLGSRAPRGVEVGQAGEDKMGLPGLKPNTFSAFSKCLRYIYLRKTKVCILANFIHRQDIFCSIIIIVQSGSNSNVNQLGDCHTVTTPQQ